MSDCYVMDKGCDSEAIHRLIRDNLHADVIIPIRSWNNVFVGGIYHQEMALHFDDVRYRKRQLVENMFVFNIEKKVQWRSKNENIPHTEEGNHRENDCLQHSLVLTISCL